MGAADAVRGRLMPDRRLCRRAAPCRAPSVPARRLCRGAAVGLLLLGELLLDRHLLLQPGRQPPDLLRQLEDPRVGWIEGDLLGLELLDAHGGSLNSVACRSEIVVKLGHGSTFPEPRHWSIGLRGRRTTPSASPPRSPWRGPPPAGTAAAGPVRD